jgi:hypothetical protein
VTGSASSSLGYLAATKRGGTTVDVVHVDENASHYRVVFIPD